MSKSKTPRLSFVIPYHNKLRTIKRCIKSLLNQSIKDTEIIVVFDGPDAEARRELSSFRGRIQILEIKPSGAPAARNAGAKIATGEFISFWDADSFIEPGAAAVWLQVFDKFPEFDFVYSAYKFPEGRGAIESERFDPWLLQVNNYISGHFPIRRKKCPVWDEKLASLQDWDFWLQAVKAGCKGLFIKGYAFTTDFPDSKSISGKGCTKDNWLDRVEVVKKKHGIPLREICVSSLGTKEDGIELAKVLEADYRDYPTYFPHKYHTIVQLGFNPGIADQHALNFTDQHGGKTLKKKILFWRPGDVFALKNYLPMAAVEALNITINSGIHHQFCTDANSLRTLTDLGFKVKLLPVPLDTKDLKTDPLPSEFAVLVDTDKCYAEIVDSVRRAMPDIKFLDLKPNMPINVKEVSAILKLSEYRALDGTIINCLINGRRAVSNLQSPFCGYVGEQLTSVEVARATIIAKIRSFQQEKDLHQASLTYWRQELSPARFKERLLQECPDFYKVEEKEMEKVA